MVVMLLTADFFASLRGWSFERRRSTRARIWSAVLAFEAKSMSSDKLS